MAKVKIYLNQEQSWNIFYREYICKTSKYNLVFCHGYDSSSLSFEIICKILSEDYSCFALDYPGHGLTEAKLSDMKLPLFGKSVAKFIENKNLKNVVLLGHSLGGGVSSYLWHHKNVCAHILLAPINPSIVGKEEILKDILLPFDADELKATWKKLIHNAKNINDTFYSIENMKATLQKIKKYRPYSTLVAKDVLSKNRQWEILYNYLSINKPCKLIFGSNDKIIPTISSIDWLKKIIKNLDISIINECGHSPQFEKPQETAKIIKEFILSL